MPTADAIAFIDWNSQSHAAVDSELRGTQEGASRTLDYVGRVVGTALHSACDTTRFRVQLRIYYGFRRGFEATAGRKAVINALSSIDLSIISRRANVLIRDEYALGETLLLARPNRLHPHYNCHLPNTFRKSLVDSKKSEEKMVDTALATDLVHAAHSDRNTWLLVLGEDDDLTPPIITADAIRNGSASMVLLARKRALAPFLKIEDLQCTPKTAFKA